MDDYDDPADVDSIVEETGDMGDALYVFSQANDMFSAEGTTDGKSNILLGRDGAAVDNAIPTAGVCEADRGANPLISSFVFTSKGRARIHKSKKVRRGSLTGVGVGTKRRLHAHDTRTLRRMAGVLLSGPSANQIIPYKRPRSMVQIEEIDDYPGNSDAIVQENLAESGRQIHSRREP